jgi:erythronate-4-phosphate dehydrogenase
MKAGAVYINSSRGAVTDSAALKRAAQSKLSAFVLDVWEGEPAPDAELLAQSFVGTPHIAGYSSDGKANGTAACIRELCRFFRLDVLPDWYPATVPPPPFPVTFALDGTGRTPEDVFYEAVTHTYPVREDSLRLKQSPETFEEQRGSYWTRREFGCYTLRLNGVDAAVADGLRELGFNVVQ